MILETVNIISYFLSNFHLLFLALISDSCLSKDAYKMMVSDFIIPSIVISWLSISRQSFLFSLICLYHCSPHEFSLYLITSYYHYFDVQIVPDLSVLSVGGFWI